LSGLYVYRASDIIPLISGAVQWLKNNESLNREKSLPLLNSHHQIFVRAIVVNVGQK